MTIYRALIPQIQIILRNEYQAKMAKAKWNSQLRLGQLISLEDPNEMETKIGHGRADNLYILLYCVVG